MNQMKRICLYAGFSSTGTIEDYVVHAVEEMSNYADVYYFAANDLLETELCKLDKYTKARWGNKHDRYDFGSWQKLIFTLGWKFIEQYDAIILLNDSCYGPLSSMETVFRTMEASAYDMWGITKNYGEHVHLQSYFLYINKKVFQTLFFKNFFETITPQHSKQLICINYEIGLSRLVCEHGFSIGSYINKEKMNIPYGVDISQYQNSLLRAGSPFIKRKVFFEKSFAKEDWSETLSLLQEYEYPFEFFPLQQAAEAEGLVNSEEPLAPKRADGLSPRALLRRAGRRLFMFFYSPIKKRIVSKIDKIYEQTDVAIGETRCEFGRLHRCLDSINARINSIDFEIATMRDFMQELHGHIDWMQRDIVIALKEGVDFNASQRFACLTEYPVAYDSPDHIHPVGTVADHTRHPRFIRACEDFFSDKKRLSFLDLGCSAGGIVLDAVLRGHIGVGLDGSGISRLQQRAEWRLLRENLFTCDISKFFTLTQNGSTPFMFNVVSAWEVLEHLTKEGVDGLFCNLNRHMHTGSILACSISQAEGGFTDDGIPLHQTIEPLVWWEEIGGRHGFELMKNSPFARFDYDRGNGNPSVYYHPLHSYKEQPYGCESVVFRKIK